MNQTRGRNAGYRKKTNSHQPYQLSKSSPSSRSRTSSQTASRDIAPTASIFKMRSFQFLVKTVGAENIALALDSTLLRVSELMKGERFTPETAFHMEATLGLPHGFFDQPHPALSPELIARLQSPLEFVQTNDDMYENAETQAIPAPSVPTTQKHLYVEDGSSKEAKMPARKTNKPPSNAANGAVHVAQEDTSETAEKKVAASRRVATEKTSTKQPSVSDSSTLHNVRRANLHVLTVRNGSKAKLGLVMGMTGSNIAHRLYGKKRLDEVEANRFTERLGLPTGWLDTPHSEAEIPEFVSVQLAPASRIRASTKDRASFAAALDTSTLNVSAPDPQSRETRFTALNRDEVRVVSEPQLSREKTEHIAQTSEIEQPAATDASTIENKGDHVTPLAPLNSESLPFSLTSLQGLDGISPIAEALLKTLAGKARTGRLNELTALEMLQKAILL